MIKKEVFKTSKRSLTRTFSDTGYMIQHKGSKALYEDAVDVSSDVEYVETTTLIPEHELSREELMAELDQTKKELDTMRKEKR